MVKKAAQKPKDWLLSLLETPEEPEIQGVVVVVVVFFGLAKKGGGCFRFPNREMLQKLKQKRKALPSEIPTVTKKVRRFGIGPGKESRKVWETLL